MSMLSSRRRSGMVSAMSWLVPAAEPPFRGGAGGGQIGVGEHRQGDVPIPGGVVPHLVGGQPGLVLGRLEALLDPPATAGHGDQLLKSGPRSEEHTSELQSRQYLVCRLLLEKKKDQQ